MFFSKKEPVKKESTIEVTVEEFLRMDARLNDIILEWVRLESKSGIQPNTKMAEMLISNFKLIYANEGHGATMRKFLTSSKNIMGGDDFIFSRIHDLYIFLKTSLPEVFLTSVQNRHKDTLVKLGYSVNEEIYASFEIGWLVHRIQYILRYNSQVVESPTPKHTPSVPKSKGPTSPWLS